MNTYPGLIKKRLIGIHLFNVIAVCFIGIAFWISRNTSHGSDLFDGLTLGFQIGIFIGLEVIMLLWAFRYKKALGDEKLLKALYIQEHDERAQLISGRIGATGFLIVLLGIGLATVVAGFINLTVFLTLMAVLMFSVSVKAALKIYYHRKY